ncbi:hypothetical protein CsatB_007484 [Cannabis sativa]
MKPYYGVQFSIRRLQGLGSVKFVLFLLLSLNFEIRDAGFSLQRTLRVDNPAELSDFFYKSLFLLSTFYQFFHAVFDILSLIFLQKKKSIRGYTVYNTYSLNKKHAF